MKIGDKGIGYGILSAVFWSINTILLSKIVEGNNIFFLPLFYAFLHDFFSSFLLYGNIRRLGYQISDIKKLSSKRSFKVMIFSAILGGPVGMASYLMSVKYLGPSYSATLSVLYPVLGAFLASIFFHEHLSKNKIIAILLSVFGVFLLSGSFEADFGYGHYKIGLFFCFLCILGWALEGNVASYFMKSENVPSEVAIFIRQMSSAIFYIFIIIPFIFHRAMIQDLFSDYHIIWIILASCLGGISYLFWYGAIDKLGASIGMLLNSTYVVWIVLMDTFFLHTDFNMKFVFSILFVLSSIFLLSRENS